MPRRATPNHGRRGDRSRPKVMPGNRNSSALANCRGGSLQGSAAFCRTRRARCASPSRKAASPAPPARNRGDERQHPPMRSRVAPRSTAETDPVACRRGTAAPVCRPNRPRPAECYCRIERSEDPSLRSFIVASPCAVVPTSPSRRCRCAML